MATTKGVNFRLKALDNTKPAFDSVNRGLRGVSKQAERTSGTMRSWNAGLNANRRAVQQLGFQMSDFAVQIAGGQSAMLAFTQQGGQMLQFFGPFGSIMAALLAIFGSLAIAFIKSGQSIETLYPMLGVLREEFSQLGAVLSWLKEFFIDFAQFTINHLDQILITAALVGGYFATKWVASFVMAQAATFTLTGALVALRTAILRLGLPALAVAMGYVIERFLALRAGAGGFGEALALLSDLWRAVVDELQTLSSALLAHMQGTARSIVSAFLGAFAEVSQGFRDLVENGLNMIPGFEIDLPDQSSLGQFADEMATSANNAYDAARTLWDSAGQTRAALQAIREAMKAGDTQIDLREILKGGGKTDEAEGGGGGSKAKSVTDKLKEEADEVKEVFEDLQQTISKSMLSGFKALLDGSKSFGDAAKDILGSIADKVIDILMTPVFDGIGGMLAGGITSGLQGIGAGFSFEGGGWTGNGIRAGGLDGKGGMLRMVHPKEGIFDSHKGTGALMRETEERPRGGDMNLSISSSIDARGSQMDRAEMQRILDQRDQQIMEDLQRKLRHGSKGWADI